MSYVGNEIEACKGPSIEERIAREMKEQKVDKNFIKAVEDIGYLYGDYVIEELGLSKAYGTVRLKYKKRKGTIKRLLNRQKRKKK